jgi:hypothetical protein
MKTQSDMSTSLRVTRQWRAKIPDVETIRGSSFLTSDYTGAWARPAPLTPNPGANKLERPAV